MADKIHVQTTTTGLAACGIYVPATQPHRVSTRGESVTCRSCLRTTLPFDGLVLDLDFRNLRALPSRLCKEGLRKRWKGAVAAGDGNTMTQVFGMLGAIGRDPGDAITTDFKAPGGEKPNIFDYATKELSQDAMICWLIRWSGVENADTDEERALKSLGRDFVDAMLTKHGGSLSGEIVKVEIYQQDHGIDVLTRVHEKDGTKHVLLIEDKTDTRDHGDQLNRYMQVVQSGETSLGLVREFWPMYLKTGNHSLQHAREIERKTTSATAPGYKVFDREDFLIVLNRYLGNHPIAAQFQSHLQGLGNDFDAWHDWSSKDRKNWSWASWEGFYRALEYKFDSSRKRGTPGKMDWGYVANPQGGFLGLWWFPFPDNINYYTFYLQLEVVPNDPARQKLCFKVEDGGSGMRPAGYYELVRIAAEKEGVKIERPRMRAGATMTVGRWPGEWLAFDADGRPDKSQTAGTLWRAQRILEVARNMSCECRGCVEAR